MNDLVLKLNGFRPQMLSVLRIMAGLLFLAHGTAKLLGFPATGMSPSITSIYGIAGIIEIVTGVLLALGLFTRPAAFLASGLGAAAYFIGHHSSEKFFPIQNGGDAAVLYCFLFLYFVFSGPGPWSVDAARGKE